MNGSPMTIDPTRLKQLAVSENGFVFDPYTGHTFTLNATGIAVLEGLKRGDSLEQIAAALSAGFDLDGSEDLARDVDDFVVRLCEHGLSARLEDGS